MPREAGYVIGMDPGSDKPIAEGSTVMCVHCGAHWVPQPGSGTVRGWCMNCNGFHCGPSCAECVPMLKMIEIMEGRDPTKVTVGLGR